MTTKRDEALHHWRMIAACDITSVPRESYEWVREAARQLVANDGLKNPTKRRIAIVRAVGLDGWADGTESVLVEALLRGYRQDQQDDPKRFGRMGFLDYLDNVWAEWLGWDTTDAFPDSTRKRILRVLDQFHPDKRAELTALLKDNLKT